MKSYGAGPPAGGRGTASQGFWAVCDQAAVSATNFLTIAMGAWLLPLPEQAKLVYVYTAYIALVLLNAAALFSAAPIMRYKIDNTPAYHRQLLRAQIGIAVVGGLLIAAVFVAVGGVLGWTPNLPEIAGLLLFFVLQQLTDFARRAEYIFGHTGLAAAMSVLTFGLRSGAMLLLRPADAGTIFFLLALSALPGAMAAFARNRAASRSGNEKEILRQHVEIARWNMASAPLRWCGLHLPVFLVGTLSGAGSAAILASVRSVSTVVNVFLELLESYVPSWMAARAHRGGSSGLRDVAARLYALGLGGWLATFLVILFFGESILALTLGPAYGQYRNLLIFLWIGNGLFFWGRLAAVHHRVGGRPSVELAGAVGGLPSLLVGIPLILAYGPLGGALALLLVQSSSVAGQLFFIRKTESAAHR